jgi:hypothetical protein
MNVGIGLSVSNFSSVPTVGLDLDAAIAALFSSGEEGAWYDPSDLTTLYQDANGFTPVTGTGQPVGLMLDKSKGLTLGSELFSDFATEGLWTDNGNGSWSITSAASTTDLRSTTLGVTGKRYRIEITFAVSSGLVAVYPLNTTPYSVSSGQTKVVFTEANYGVISDQLWIRAATGTTATVSNISVKELPGNHATQSTSTARPTLQLSGSSYYLDFDGADDRISTATLTSQSQPFTMATASRLDAVPTAFYLVDGPDGAARVIHYGFSDNTQVYAGSAVVLGSTSSVLGTQSRVWFSHFNTTDSTVRVDGADVATSANVGTGSWEGIKIGARTSTNADRFNGGFYGLIFVNRTLDPDEITNVESYLADKTGAFVAPVITGVPTISVS